MALLALLGNLVLYWIVFESLAKSISGSSKDSGANFIIYNGRCDLVFHWWEEGQCFKNNSTFEYKKRLTEEYQAGVYVKLFLWSQDIQSIVMSIVLGSHVSKHYQYYAYNCPQYAIETGVWRKQSPPMTSILIDHPNQTISVDIMKLSLTTNGNRNVIVFQDLFTKWPIVYAAPDQKALC